MFGAALGALPSFIFTGFVVLLGRGRHRCLRAFVGGSPMSCRCRRRLGAGIAGHWVRSVRRPAHRLRRWCRRQRLRGQAVRRHEPQRGRLPLREGHHVRLRHRPDILAVGGVFGILTMADAADALPIEFGIPIAVLLPIGIALSAVGFAYPLIGVPAGSGLLDMSPFEKGEMRGDGSGRPATEPWLPHQYKWVNIVVIGLGAGILGGWAWLITGSFFLAYGISAASLLFLNLGVEKFPVTHHMTLPATSSPRMAMTDAPVACRRSDSPSVLPAMSEFAPTSTHSMSVLRPASRVDHHDDPHPGILALAGVFTTSAAIPLP